MSGNPYQSKQTGAEQPYGRWNRHPTNNEIRKVAPDNFAHPTDALRRYLASHVIDDSTDGLGRVSSHCESEFGCTPEGAPLSEFGGDGIVQATQGSGPSWLKREFVTTDSQNAQ